ncbi:MAG: hypothetical protein ABSF29_05970 [Tepidisphaeraceae bacterium]|jgi:hypothetical protein
MSGLGIEDFISSFGPETEEPRSRVELETAGLQNRKYDDATANIVGTSESSQNHLSADLSLNVINHPELTEVMRAWPSLPKALRAGIMAMVKSAKPT